MVTATRFVVAGFFGMLALWWWGCTLSASCMYLRTTHMAAGTRMSYRCRERIAQGEIPWEKTQRIMDKREWIKDTACTLCFFACACDKRAVVTATHYIYTCFFCFGHVLLVRSHVAGDPRRCWTTIRGYDRQRRTTGRDEEQPGPSGSESDIGALVLASTRRAHIAFII